MQEQDYLAHGPLSDPGEHAAAFAGLPDDIAGLCAVVQGILLHDHQGGLLYGPAPADFADRSRTTLPVRERLAAILARDPAPLAQARAPFERSVGTCRDFALMLSAMLRHKGVPARVRCGFARYFGGGWEDHWVCEYVRGQRWALADPQLDGAHIEHLAIAFDPADMPRDGFLCAWQAWRAIRQEGVSAERFGHGDATGLWFVEVNLARDLHALARRETSPWDGWRQATARDRVLNAGRLRTAQAMADRARDGLSGADVHGGGTGVFPPPPPWMSEA